MVGGRDAAVVGTVAVVVASVVTGVFLFQRHDTGAAADLVEWTDLGVAWTDTEQLHFQDAAVRLRTNPLSVAQTRDSALYVFETGKLRELASSGEDTALSSTVRGIPIADDTGHLAGWIEGRGEHLRMMAYDTATHRIVDQREADAETFVTAVDGDTIIFVTAEDSFR